jgi:FtsZ-binding cell division protein ZapB
LAASACGSGGGGSDGGGEGDLPAQAAQAGALLDQIEALPTTATTANQFSTELETLRNQLRALTQEVQETSAPDELGSQKKQLENRLQGLQTQLGRVQSLLAADDLEGAETAIGNLLSIEQVRQTIASIEDAS